MAMKKLLPTAAFKIKTQLRARNNNGWANNGANREAWDTRAYSFYRPDGTRVWKNHTTRGTDGLTPIEAEKLMDRILRNSGVRTHVATRVPRHPVNSFIRPIGPNDPADRSPVYMTRRGRRAV